jgi:hypothetical protein
MSRCATSSRQHDFVRAPWTIEVSLKPGIHSLSVTASEDDGSRRTSRPHTIVVE